jgi:uncharacterized protein YkwD
VATRKVSLALLAALVLGMLVLVAPTGAAPGRSELALTSLESNVLQQLNTIRRQNGLASLRLNALLTDAAVVHTTEMGQDGYFEHTSDDGTAFWKRIDRWYGSDGYRYWSVGENLLWSSPSVDPAAALRLWMKSPEHRANILDSRWREIGISAVHVDAAPGVYHGRDVTIITTDFGVRK